MQTNKRGRPPLPPEEKLHAHTVRLELSRIEKLKALGKGWLSRAIDRAKVK